jgi:error-prone DNA polymerase
MNAPGLVNAVSQKIGDWLRFKLQRTFSKRLLSLSPSESRDVARPTSRRHGGTAYPSGSCSAEELRTRKDGEFVRAAGCVIARQRPGTAKGFIFISMEDETEIANVIVTPDLYEQDRIVVTRSRFLLVEGPLQNQDNVIHVKATRLAALSDRALEIRAHDFH